MGCEVVRSAEGELADMCDEVAELCLFDRDQTTCSLTTSFQQGSSDLEPKHDTFGEKYNCCVIYASVKTYAISSLQATFNFFGRSQHSGELHFAQPPEHDLTGWQG